MLFNSVDFAVFFAVVLVLYWVVHRNRNAKNFVLLGASLFFYGQLHYSFPIYLMALVTLSYLFGRQIGRQENERQRKIWLVMAVCVLSAGLIYTKYSGFLLGNISGLEQWQATALGILAPVGISFYTFAVIGYVLDVYYESIAAEANYLSYATYVSFFPQLLSGPIPSAITILPQFNKKPKVSINSVAEGIGEFLWGLFKKRVVADNISMAVSFCFSTNNEDLSGSSLFIGAALFGVCIYADFSGYSSMARGCAKLLGIDLIQNFNTPLFSTSISEYWRRWHISLTNWLYAYIYNPMVFGLKRWGRAGIILGIFITFLVSGIWHGAGWQYIIFGVVNGLAIIYEILTKEIRQKIFGRLPRLVTGVMSNLFVLVFMLLSWIFFRANSVEQAMNIISRISSASLFSAPDTFVSQYLVWCVPLMLIEWVQRKGKYAMDVQQWLPTKVMRKDRAQDRKIMRLHIVLKIILYILLTVAIFLFSKKVNMAEYYYFKF
jgi:alginate O-acetyltransferase complex protein AlgI